MTRRDHPQQKLDEIIADARASTTIAALVSSRERFWEFYGTGARLRDDEDLRDLPEMLRAIVSWYRTRSGFRAGLATFLEAAKAQYEAATDEQVARLQAASRAGSDAS